MAEVHLTETVSSFLGDTWTAMCSCGWHGVAQDTISAASYDCHSHREFAALPLPRNLAPKEAPDAS